jgi:hypothetical protein
MKLVGLVARMGDDRSVYDLGEADHLEDMGIDGRTILKWTWTGLMLFRTGTGGGLL